MKRRFEYRLFKNLVSVLLILAVPAGLSLMIFTFVASRDSDGQPHPDKVLLYIGLGLILAGGLGLALCDELEKKQMQKKRPDELEKKQMQKKRPVVRDHDNLSNVLRWNTQSEVRPDESANVSADVKVEKVEQTGKFSLKRMLLLLAGMAFVGVGVVTYWAVNRSDGVYDTNHLVFRSKLTNIEFNAVRILHASIPKAGPNKGTCVVNPGRLKLKYPAPALVSLELPIPKGAHTCSFILDVIKVYQPRTYWSNCDCSSIYKSGKSPISSLSGKPREMLSVLIPPGVYQVVMVTPAPKAIGPALIGNPVKTFVEVPRPPRSYTFVY